MRRRFGDTFGHGQHLYCHFSGSSVHSPLDLLGGDSNADAIDLAVVLVRHRRGHSAAKPSGHCSEESHAEYHALRKALIGTTPAASEPVSPETSQPRLQEDASSDSCLTRPGRSKQIPLRDGKDGLRSPILEAQGTTNLQLTWNPDRSSLSVFLPTGGLICACAIDERPSRSSQFHWVRTSSDCRQQSKGT